jgi:hypothetical protein
MFIKNGKIKFFIQSATFLFHLQASLFVRSLALFKRDWIQPRHISFLATCRQTRRWRSTLKIFGIAGLPESRDDWTIGSSVWRQLPKYLQAASVVASWNNLQTTSHLSNGQMASAQTWARADSI